MNFFLSNVTKRTCSILIPARYISAPTCPTVYR